MKKHNKKSVKTPVIIGAIGTAVCAGAAALAVGLKKSFRSMKESARAQHEVDKANFAAAKAESKANWEEAKAMGKPAAREAMMQAERDQQIQEANVRREAAEARIQATKQ